MWKMILCYVLILHIAAMLQALLLYIGRRLIKKHAERKSIHSLLLLWLSAHMLTLCIVYGISVFCFSYLPVEHGKEHALWLTVLYFVMMLMAFPFVSRKLKRESGELFDDGRFHGPFYD